MLHKTLINNIHVYSGEKNPNSQQIRFSCMRVAFTATAENVKEKALQVMARLAGYRQPELWEVVSPYFVKEGQLDLRTALTVKTLPSLVYLLSSGAALDVVSLE